MGNNFYRTTHCISNQIHDNTFSETQIIRLLTDKQLQQAVTQPLNPNTLKPVTITKIFIHIQYMNMSEK